MLVSPTTSDSIQLGDACALELMHDGPAARVYRGLLGSTPVACKVYPPDRSATMDERVRRECSLQARADHPCLAPLLDFGIADDGCAYAISRWVDGETLSTRISRGPIPWAELIAIAMDVTRALSAVHELKVVHRDVKPSNIMVCEGGAATLLDFGHSLLLDEVRLTETGKVLGTPAYMAPEQAEGTSLDGRADLYSLGAVLYEALTGQPVFARDSVAAVLECHLCEPVTPPSERAPELTIPPAADDLVLWLLEKAPNARVPNARVLFHSLCATR